MHVILRLGTLKEVHYPDRFKAKVVRERQEASEGVMPGTYCGPFSWPLAAPLTSKYLRTFTCATGLKASAHVRQMESNVLLLLFGVHGRAVDHEMTRTAAANC